MTTSTAALDFRTVDLTHHKLPTIAAHRINDKLGKLNKRLAKIGAPAATVAYGPVVDHYFTDEFGVKRTERVFETVTVTGFEAKFAGWTPVATLDHELAADEALVARFPGQLDVEIPESFRFRGPVCDHCGQTRNRSKTVLFLGDDGAWQQIGTSCILDFIGIDPTNLLNLRWDFPEEDEERELGSWRNYVPLPREFVAYAAEATRQLGFVPSQCAWDQVSTKDRAWTLVGRGLSRSEFDALYPNFDADRGNAAFDEIVAWAAAQPASDFITSARLALRSDVVTTRTAGILASLPHVYLKSIAKAESKKAEEKRPSEFVGEIGKRIVVVGEVIVAQTYKNDFHYYAPDNHLIVVRTDEGDKVSTFGSGRTLVGLERGDRIQLTGTVAEHKDDEKYGKETKVKRAKAENVEAVEAA